MREMRIMSKLVLSKEGNLEEKYVNIWIIQFKASEGTKTLLRLLLPLNEQVWFTSPKPKLENQPGPQSVKLTNSFDR